MRKCQGRCGLMKGINAFRPYSVLCNDCRKNPPPAPPVVELVVDEKLEAFIRSTRVAAGCPRRAGA